jgi:hypothetical protein
MDQPNASEDPTDQGDIMIGQPDVSTCGTDDPLLKVSRRLVRLDWFMLLTNYREVWLGPIDNHPLPL